MTSKTSDITTCFDNQIKNITYNKGIYFSNKVFFPFLIIFFLSSNTYSKDSFWVDCSSEQLKNWKCSMNVYKTLWMDGSKSTHKNLKEFSQDFFSWVTMFIGFIVFIAITYSGFLMITWWADEKQFENWKKWLIYSLIWLLLVGWAYGIIRFIQLIAKW